MATCPATGRSASVCLDQTHAQCSTGAEESRRLDERLQAAHDQAEGPSDAEREF